MAYFMSQPGWQAYSGWLENFNPLPISSPAPEVRICVTSCFFIDVLIIALCCSLNQPILDLNLKVKNKISCRLWYFLTSSRLVKGSYVQWEHRMMRWQTWCLWTWSSTPRCLQLGTLDHRLPTGWTNINTWLFVSHKLYWNVDCILI